MIKEIIAYLKDNPKGYWFKRKLYGWGWTPATKEGWFVTLGFITFVFIIALQLVENPSDDSLLSFFILLAIGVIVLITISYKTGEKLKWQWGIPDKYKKNKDSRPK